MARRKCKRRFSATEEDPMAGTANLVDAMLVIAVGLLVFLIISWNMQGVVMEQAQTEVEQGQQLNDTPDVSESSGQGYTEMGTVYKDPKTGKLIMVEET
ncbi:MAG: DUF2149 domain-containing protein [Methanobacteriaceae archaeon]|nr:DUF2149 domain-containing protein [Methanobacteriaceae archaeon]